MASSPKRKKLIIVESPAKARTISRFLGNGYVVEASQGHVRDLPKSQLGVDPDQNFAMKYITIRGRGDIISSIRKEAKNASQVFLATDPDREGEAIAWHLAYILGIEPEKANRVEFHEITKSVVQNAMKNPRTINTDLVDAQQARRALDRLVGYQISPLLWAKIKKGLSAGRVQSVVTRMVVMRENEIDAFIPEEYWDIHAKASVGQGRASETFPVVLSNLHGKKASISSAQDASAAKATAEKGTYHISHVRTGEKRRMPSPPFTTSSLQQEASRKLNFSTAKTMQVVQQLYEGIDIKGGTQGLVTYIRTDSVRMSQDAINAIRSYIPERFGAGYIPAEPNEYKGRKNAQDAHEAIRPTDIQRTPETVKEFLTRDQYQLYKLIYSRTIASQMAPAVYTTLTAEFSSEHAEFRYYGEKKTFAGFTVLYEDSQDDPDAAPESLIPNIHEGDRVTITDVDGVQHFSQPPARYTEASLVRTMEEKGIGRPSTYAPTITTILNRGYVSREKKRLYPTELGRMVTTLMEEYFPDIVDIDFTANLEEKLDEVEEGQKNWKEILQTFYPSFEMELTKAEQEIEKVEIKDEVSDVICDQCGSHMVYKMGRYGRFLACPNFPACRNTKPIIHYIDAPCPKCGARLLEKISKKNRKFYGCEKYPECDFVSWEMPVKEHCPQCGSYMVQKKGKHGDVWHLCAGTSCHYKVKIENQGNGMDDEGI